MKSLISILLIAITLVVSAQDNRNIKKLLQAQYVINEFYVDSVSEDKITEDAIRGILSKLDPHSTYSTPKETKELNEPLQGSFSGVGIQFNMQQDTLYVIQTIVGGPSERVGILAGDRIIAVNDSTIAGVKMSNTDIQKRLRGPKGSKVTVNVLRRGVAKPITFRITRDDIPLYSIDASYMIDDKTGYVKISRFAATTHTEFADAVNDLRKRGMKQLIIDLADNGGGYMQPAVEIANQFLKRGEMIVYTEGKKSPRSEIDADGRGSLKDEKLVIVVNQYSASASEILSGAIQDWDRGVIIGRRTFGKGLVQRPFQFEDGSMIRLTTARYYTPSGRSIQKHYEKGDRRAYEMDIINRYNDGELTKADSNHFADSLRYTTHGGRTIYGGGGIMPDVFIPIDTTEYSDYYRDMVAKGIINNFAIKFVDKNRKSLKKSFATVHDYNKGFTVSDEMMKDFIAAGENDSIKFDAKQYEKSGALMRDIIKALIARDVYTDPGAYFVVINHRNREVQEALSVINDDRRYQSLLKNKE